MALNIQDLVVQSGPYQSRFDSLESARQYMQDRVGQDLVFRYGINNALVTRAEMEQFGLGEFSDTFNIPTNEQITAKEGPSPIPIEDTAAKQAALEASNRETLQTPQPQVAPQTLGVSGTQSTQPAQPSTIPSVSYEQLQNQGGTIVNPTTGKRYSKPEELAVDLGVQPDKIDWSKITSASVTQPTGRLVQARGGQQVAEVVPGGLRGVESPTDPRFLALGGFGATEQVEPEEFERLRVGQKEQVIEEAQEFGIDDLEAKVARRPEKTFEQLYAEVYKNLGLEDIKTRITKVQERLSKIDQDYATATGDINLNPWLSEAGRVGQVAKLNQQYQLSRSGIVSELTLLNNELNTGRDDARAFAKDVLAAFHADREIDEDALKIAVDKIEREAEAKKYTSGIIGEYKFYTEQEVQAGRKPLSFSEYQTLDANRKRSTTNISVQQQKILSPSEAALLGVPYGTTAGEASGLGIVPSPAGQTSAAAQTTKANVESGLKALNKIEEELKRDPSVLLRSFITGGLAGRTFVTARNEITDVISRLRTGAALTENEEKFYRGQLPNEKDILSPQTISYKINLYRELFNRLQSSYSPTRNTIQTNDPLNIR